MQRGMFFHGLGEPGQGLYIQQLVCRLREDLDVSAFKEAWRQIVGRHAIFRAALLGDSPGEWSVHSSVPLPFEEHDWTGTPAGDLQRRLDHWLAADRRAGLDPAAAPLLRLNLFRLAEGDFYFIWTSHHAILDGRSRRIVLKELFAFYDALRQGRPLALPEPAPFRNYLRWLENQAFDKAEAFWRNLLGGLEAPPPLDFGFPAPRPGEESYGIQRHRLSPALTAALRALSRENGFTLNTLLQGAWAILLGRYSNREEVVFGATRACRVAGVPGAASMAGLLINTVPMRVAVPAEGTLVEWLKMIREQWVAMRAYEHTPLDKILAWSGLPAGQPLFESLVVFERYLLDSALRAQGGPWENRRFEVRGLTNYPLVISGYDDEALLLEFVYQRSRLDDATISRTAGHLEALLEGMAARPLGTLASFSCLTPEEERMIVEEWNATATAYPRDSSIPDVFERQARETPQDVAVVFGPERLTYGELDRRANQAAHCMRQHGIRRNVPVGICMERSLEMIVGLLGILKAGGTYVPLDPGWPGERIAGLAADAQIRLVLTHRATVKRLPASASALCLDTLAPGCKPETNPAACESDSKTNPDDLAYVMFTSGSTGKPKGVRVPHRGVVRLVKETNYCRFTRRDVFLQFAPLAFDASTFEIWGCLLNGGTLVVAPPHIPSLDELGRWIQENQVTTLWLTSSLFQQMVDGPLHLLSGVKQLLAGGDRLPSRHVREFLSKNRTCQLINGYGPTENTTFTCCYQIISGKAIGESVPIGRPVANTQVYLLDSRLRPAPAGVPGELYIGGDGLADGYLNAPEWTAAQFVPNPFDPAPGSRLYRSGDIARYRPDGVIEFLGRRDGQVKIRGFRIEPGEIEERLLQHPALSQAAVAVRTYTSGEKYLAAYLIGGRGRLPAADELREFLERTLPEPMLPRSFTFLPSFPLNANGKVDRARLPAPELPLERERVRCGPRTPVEAELARIWRELLGLHADGIRDSFFHVGGSSLMAMRMMSEVRKSFGVDLPVSVFLCAPTIEGLAARIETLRCAQGTAFPVASARRKSKIPISVEQEKGLRLMRSAPGAALENIVRVLRLRGPLQIDALQSSFNHLMERHESLRTFFVLSASGAFHQVIAERRAIRLDMVDLGGRSAEERAACVGEYAAAEVQAPFTWSESPLLRLRLLRLGEDDHILVFAISHLVCDGWSLSVLFAELAAVYSALVKKQAPQLPDLPIQFADFAIWERDQLRGETLEKLADFWRNNLAGDISPLVLPAALPRPPSPSFLAHALTTRLPRERSESVKRLARREGVSPFMFFCALFAVLLHRESGRDDIIIDMPVARRTHPQIQRTVGWFAKTNPVRINLAGNPSFQQLLQQVKQALLEAVTHGMYPAWELHRLAGRQENPNPLSQFDLVEVPDSGLGCAFHQLDAEFLPLKTVNTDWDLRIQLEWTREDLIVRFHYRPDLFLRKTVEAMLSQYLALVENALHSPGSPLSALMPEANPPVSASI